MPGFQPVLNNQVKAIVGLPDGRLAVGGQFTQVERRSRDRPRRRSTRRRARRRRLAGRRREPHGRRNVAQVRGLSINGQCLYVSGSFTHLVGSSGVTSSSWNGARINLAAGVPRHQVEPQPQRHERRRRSGDRRHPRVLRRATSSQSGATQTPNAAAFQSAAGAPLVQPLWAPDVQQARHELTANLAARRRRVSGRVYIGGSEHSLFGYDRSTFALRSGSITKAGGDFQVVEANSDTVFAGCHCGDFNYQERLHLERHRHELDAGRQHQPVRRVGCRDRQVHRRLQPDHPGTSRLRRRGRCSRTPPGPSGRAATSPTRPAPDRSTSGRAASSASACVTPSAPSTAERRDVDARRWDDRAAQLVGLDRQPRRRPGTR